MEKYNKLKKITEYDEEAVEQLIASHNEIADLRSQIVELQELIDENDDLHNHIWKSGDGELIAHHKIEQDHLENIITYSHKTGRQLSAYMQGEIRKRGIDMKKVIADSKIKKLNEEPTNF